MFQVNKENKEAIIMGDFNLNLLKLESCDYINHFLDIMLEIFFHPHIVQPTRFSDKGMYSPIDNIFFNNIEQTCLSGNLLPHISDHLPNFLIIDKGISHNTTSKRMKRDFRNFNSDNFLNALQNLHLDENVDRFNSTDDKYNFFHNSISNLFDEFVPLKKLSKKEIKQLKKPWITNSILALIKTKNMLNTKFVQSGSSETLSEYRILRNNINHQIRKSKYLYYKNYFSHCTNDIKKFWKGVNSYLNRKQVTNSNSTNMIVIGDNTYTDPVDISNHFNSYFVNVAPSLQENLQGQSLNKDFYSYLGDPVQGSFFIDPVTPKEINDIICQLDSKKSTDIYINFRYK